MTTSKIQNQQCFNRVTAPLLIAATLLLPSIPVLAQPAKNPGVLPPNSAPFGKTYGQWAAEHWKWLYSMPVGQHPLFDNAPISTGQSGQVWFLGGTFAVTGSGTTNIGSATRSGTIPAGKALFFPIIDSECGTIEGNGNTDAELRSCAAGSVDHTVSVTCEIDGQSVQNLSSFRVQSPLYTYGPLPANNVLQYFGVDAPAGSTSLSVADGYFVMLAPLSAGQHTIHFAGIILFTQAQDGFDELFELDITYHLTVQ
jgi:hypothetical protein